MPAKSARKGVRDNPEQSKRFIEMGKELGADQKPRALSKALRKMTGQKPKQG